MRHFLAILLIVFLSGCSFIPKVKWPTWASLKGDEVTNTSGTVAEAKSGAQAVDRMAEIARRENEARKALEEKYDKFRDELQKAYNKREVVDNDNFDRISELNYGIYFATKDLVTTDNRILIANLKSQANMNRLMPLSEDIKNAIEAEIKVDIALPSAEIVKKYEKALADGLAAAKAYEEADAQVKRLEQEKIKLRAEEKIVMAKVLAEQEAERARLKKEADDAIEIAKEKQRQEMLGWIVKGLLGVGAVVMIIGLLMKAPTLIISGIFCLGLSYSAAMLPMWVIPTLMGVVVLMMVLLDPKTGKPCFLKKKSPFHEDPKPIAPPPSSNQP